MPFFSDTKIADTSQKNAASQTASADKMLGVTGANEPALGKSFSQNRQMEGRQSADFWQGNKQNLQGVRNEANGSNRAANLGQSFSVMQGAGDANSANANTTRQASKTAQLVDQYGFAQNLKTGANALQQERDIFDAQNEIELKNGTWNAIADGLNSAVSTYTAGNELFNKGGLDKLKDGVSSKVSDLKNGFKGKSTLMDGLKSYYGFAKQRHDTNAAGGVFDGWKE